MPLTPLNPHAATWNPEYGACKAIDPHPLGLGWAASLDSLAFYVFGQTPTGGPLLPPAQEALGIGSTPPPEFDWLANQDILLGRGPQTSPAPRIEAHCSVRIALTPLGEAASVLDKQSRICNWLYNYLLEEALKLRELFKQGQDPEVGKQLYSQTGLRNRVPQLKEQFPHLTLCHSSVTKNVALRLTQSIQSYQKAKKSASGRKVGWPGFRSWAADWFSLLYDEPKKGFKIEGDLLHLSCGVDEQGRRIRIRLKLACLQALKGVVIRTLRIVKGSGRKEAGRFYAVFSVIKTVKAPQERASCGRVIAFDPNHKNLMVGVDLEGNAIEVEAPHWLKKLDARLDELKALRDRCQRKSIWIGRYDAQGDATGKGRWRPSRRWQMLQNRIEGLLSKRRMQTQIFLRQLAHRLYRSYDVVGVGHYTPQASSTPAACRRSMCNQSLIGRLKEVLAWVAKKSGKHFLIFDERGTTRTCHHCGHVVAGGIAPSLRSWTCAGCQTHHSRDENAAQNGLRRVLDVGRQAADEPNVMEIARRWLWRIKPAFILQTERVSCGNDRISEQKNAS